MCKRTGWLWFLYGAVIVGFGLALVTLLSLWLLPHASETGKQSEWEGLLENLQSLYGEKEDE